MADPASGLRPDKHHAERGSRPTLAVSRSRGRSGRAGSWGLSRARPEWLNESHLFPVPEQDTDAPGGVLVGGDDLVESLAGHGASGYPSGEANPVSTASSGLLATMERPP